VGLYSLEEGDHVDLWKEGRREGGRDGGMVRIHHGACPAAFSGVVVRATPPPYPPSLPPSLSPAPILPHGLLDKHCGLTSSFPPSLPPSRPFARPHLIPLLEIFFGDLIVLPTDIPKKEAGGGREGGREDEMGGSQKRIEIYFSSF
jgi:hypothetical protein